MSKAVDLRIRGMVQGVSFRAYARQQAEGLGVAGWIRNEPDGSVGGHFEGAPHAVDALVAWCEHGPSYAEVEHVEVSEGTVTGASGFEIRPG